MTIKLARMDGGTVDLAPEALQSFKAGFNGSGIRLRMTRTTRRRARSGTR